MSTLGGESNAEYVSTPAKIPYRVVSGCQEHCGAMRCGRVAGHKGLHETKFNGYRAMVWPAPIDSSDESA